jgi:hypothetical protein
MLNLTARNLMKAKKFTRATDAYSTIINNYSDERTGRKSSFSDKIRRNELNPSL